MSRKSWVALGLAVAGFAADSAAQQNVEQCRGSISAQRRTSILTASCPDFPPRQELTYEISCHDQCGHQTYSSSVQGLGLGACVGFGECSEPIICYPQEGPERYLTNPPRFVKNIFNQRGLKPAFGCIPLRCADSGASEIAGECECGGPMSECVQDPLILSLGDSAIQLTDRSGGVVFDLDADGNPERTSWTRAGRREAFLVLDRNDNGVVDSGVELFGDATPQPETETKNGFLALAVFDDAFNGGNEDGRIDATDSIFPRLRLWVDLNHNGHSEPSELSSLGEEGVERISLVYQLIDRVDRHGNRFVARGRFENGHGRDGVVWDVAFHAP